MGDVGRFVRLFTFLPQKGRMGDVATIPLFLNRKGAKDAKVVFLFFHDQNPGEKGRFY